LFFLGGFLKKTAVSWVGSNFINPGRDRQLISFEVHFEKAAFSEEIDRFSWRYWVHCARCNLQDNEHRGTEKAQIYPGKCPSGRPYYL